MKPVVLDASALIAAIYEEPGAEIVAKHLPNGRMSAVNLAEVASYMVRQGMALATIRELLGDLGLAIASFDEGQAMRVAGLLPKTKAKGLSLGDRACLALAMAENLPVLTADKAWKTLDAGVKITLIR